MTPQIRIKRNWKHADRVTPELNAGDVARRAPVPGRSNVEMSKQPGNTRALVRSLVAAPGDGRTPKKGCRWSHRMVIARRFGKD